jgi:hypothetical protein
MEFGLTKIMNVRLEMSRSGSTPQNVLFDAEFLIYWINRFVFKPLGCQNIHDFNDKYLEIYSKVPNQKKISNPEEGTND